MPNNEQICKSVTIVLHGDTDEDIEQAFEEAVTLINAGNTSGHNSNDTGAFSFDITDADARNANVFYSELIDSVETLTEIAEIHGARTLADLMYLQNAILTGGFIDYYPDESNVLEIAGALPSGEQWSEFIKVEYLASPA